MCLKRNKYKVLKKKNNSNQIATLQGGISKTNTDLSIKRGNNEIIRLEHLKPPHIIEFHHINHLNDSLL